MIKSKVGLGREGKLILVGQWSLGIKSGMCDFLRKVLREVNEILRVERIELRKHSLFVEFDIIARQLRISPFNIHVIIVIITTALILIQALQCLNFLLSTLVILYLFWFLVYSFLVKYSYLINFDNHRHL